MHDTEYKRTCQDGEGHFQWPHSPSWGQSGAKHPHPKWSHQRAETFLKAHERRRTCPLPAPGAWHIALQPPPPLQKERKARLGGRRAQWSVLWAPHGDGIFSPLWGRTGCSPKEAGSSPEEEGPTVAPQLARLSAAAAPRSMSPGAERLPCSWLGGSGRLAAGWAVC